MRAALQVGGDGGESNSPSRASWSAIYSRRSRRFFSLLSGPPSTGFRSASRLYLRRAPHRRQAPQHFDLSAPDHQPAEVRLKWTAVYLGSSGCVIAIYWLAPVLRG